MLQKKQLIIISKKIWVCFKKTYMRCRLWRNRILIFGGNVPKALILHLKHTQIGARGSPRKPRRVSRYRFRSTTRWNGPSSTGTSIYTLCFKQLWSSPSESNFIFTLCRPRKSTFINKQRHVQSFKNSDKLWLLAPCSWVFFGQKADYRGK